ncbi:MAG: type II toxin-antitoxin system HicA family toxin [Clostridiales bacterium]|nr:type II toxin-antitoxin system HicA family toxin [Clostridiales bacterium]
MTGIEMIKKLMQEGFKIRKIKGSHYHMKKNNNVVVVPHHNKELGKGLYNQILVDAGLIKKGANAK